VSQPTKIQEALKLHAVPKERWQKTAQKTFLGTLFVALGIVGAAKWAWSVWVVVGLCIFGAHIMSSQIITASVKNLIPLLKAIVNIVRGKDD
jgi:fatty acid desaturase